MAPARVLRFVRSDDESAFILLQVTSKGSRPLDLKLVGTEGEAPYVASLKQDRVSSLRAKNCPASESEWQTILESVFNQEALSDIQVTATVQTESTISITVRKDTRGITQRLGAITLHHDADEAIELFEWCGAAVEASVDAKRAAADLTAKSQESDAAIAQLKSQLEELLHAKEEDETALLRKFRDLLNEKKVKIREQHQVLASGSFNVNPDSSTQSKPAASPPPPKPAKSMKPVKPSRKAGESRNTKRKQPASKRVEESDDDESPDAMDVDIKQEPEDTDPGNTTEATASADSDEDDEDDEVDDAPPAEQTRTEEVLPKKATEQPPPKRSLPFNNKRAEPSPAPPVGNETDSDDEL